MYLDFYGLVELPFNLTPDTNFLFPSRVHREVLAHLLYGVNSRKGFIMVTGEVGSGKTTLCRALLMKLGPNTEYALVLNSFLSELELLKTINEDLGIQSTRTGPAESTKKELIDDLNDFLLEQRMKGKNVVVIIDEAQNLSFPVLEQIRMLSNLETEKEKLLQIVLVGQPELRGLLTSPKLRQLNQRITVRHHIVPLTKKETIQYIYHRLRIAGSSGNVVFADGALNEIYRFSGGIPRMINVICDQALLAGYVAGSVKIDRKMVRAAGAEIEGIGKPRRGLLRRPLPVFRIPVATGLALTACLIALAALRPTIQEVLFPDKPSGEGTAARGGKSATTATELLAKKQPPQPPEQHAAGTIQHTAKVDLGASQPGEKEDSGSGVGDQKVAEATLPLPLPAGRPPEKPREEVPSPGKTLPPSLLRLAFLAGPTSRLGQTLPRVLASDTKPLFFSESPTLSSLPPRPKVKLPKAPSLAKASDRRIVAYRSFVDPMFTLLRLWKRTPATIQAVRQRYGEVGQHVPSLAAAADMGWVGLRADLPTLRMIDIPAIVEITGESNEQKGYLALVTIGETWVDVVTAEGNKRLDMQLFSNVFTGNAIVFCDNTFVNPEPLRQGQGINLDVRKLQDYMRNTGYFKANPSGWFTPETTAAVMAFQKDHGLPVSGEADGRTRLLLYASQGLPQIPHLCALE